MKKSNKGFTLLELLVVIALLGIMAAIVIASLNSSKSKGDDASLISGANSMRTQGELYYSNNSNSYGATTASCDGGLFDATTPGGLNTIMENLKTKAGAANLSCVASSTAWAVGIKLKEAGTYCVDGRGSGKASTTLTTASSAYNASTGLCL